MTLEGLVEGIINMLDVKTPVSEETKKAIERQIRRYVEEKEEE